MFNFPFFNLYAKVTKNDKQVKGYYTLLEEVTLSSFRNSEKGLVKYSDELSPYVEFIRYEYNNDGHINFYIECTKGNLPNSTIISYRNENMLLIKAICRFIEGQISDGWGENGLKLYDFEKGKTINVEVSSTLEEIDYQAECLARDNAEKLGNEEFMKVNTNLNIHHYYKPINF